LSREDQRRLGDLLQRVYDDVVREGVPDRFKELLDRLDQPPEAQPFDAASAPAAPAATRQSDEQLGSTARQNEGTNE
jgi:hypothetical protein